MQWPRAYRLWSFRRRKWRDLRNKPHESPSDPPGCRKWRDLRNTIHQVVGCRLHRRRIQLTEMTDRQAYQSRWILDQQTERKLFEDHKCPGKFTGRVGKQTDQKELMWEVPVGQIYISRSNMNTQELRGGTDKLGIFTLHQATVVRVIVQADATDRHRPDSDERHTGQIEKDPQEQERGENQMGVSWST